MGDIIISVKNRGPDNQRFLLINDKPGYSSSVGKSFFTVWGRSKVVGPQDGSLEFGLDDEVFAICGTSEKPLAPDPVLSNSDQRGIKLSTDNEEATSIPLIAENGNVLFASTKPERFIKSGSFGISCPPYKFVDYSK